MHRHKTTGHRFQRTTHFRSLSMNRSAKSKQTIFRIVEQRGFCGSYVPSYKRHHWRSEP